MQSFIALFDQKQMNVISSKRKVYRTQYERPKSEIITQKSKKKRSVYVLKRLRRVTLATSHLHGNNVTFLV